MLDGYKKTKNINYTYIVDKYTLGIEDDMNKKYKG